MTIKAKIGKLRIDALKIALGAIELCQPEKLLTDALRSAEVSGKLYILSIGKAAWTMADTAQKILQNKISAGLVITRYGHSKGVIPHLEILEAGHPDPDINSLHAVKKAQALLEEAQPEDTLIFLLSGGGSSLFEFPLEGLKLDDIACLAKQLMNSAADITELNTVRKQLSQVKGGGFLNLIPAMKIRQYILSDIPRINNPQSQPDADLSLVASGLLFPGERRHEEFYSILAKYNISVSSNIADALKQTEKKAKVYPGNIETICVGNNRTLLKAAGDIARSLGYVTEIINAPVCREARVQAVELIREAFKEGKPYGKHCLIGGGETVVNVKGTGVGGRNTEFALAAALQIENRDDIVVIAIGSDGTDGITEAAGGLADGFTSQRISVSGFSPGEFLENNDSYTALGISGDLIFTGATGTNINDLYMVLQTRKSENQSTYKS